MQPARPVATTEAAPPGARLATARPATAATCGCGHGRTAHLHYRRGTDCASCDCLRYRRPVLRRLLSLLAAR